MNWDLFVAGKRVVTQAQAEETLLRPAARPDRDDVIASVRRVYPRAVIVPSSDRRGNWLVTWSDGSECAPKE